MNCRICWEGDESERVIAVCKCKGTMKFVHASCLNRWHLKRNGLRECELCHTPYPKSLITLEAVALKLFSALISASLTNLVVSLVMTLMLTLCRAL